eukprot:5982193-Amphidinium_carterae.1
MTCPTFYSSTAWHRSANPAIHKCTAVAMLHKRLAEEKTRPVSSVFVLLYAPDTFCVIFTYRHSLLELLTWFAERAVRTIEVALPIDLIINHVQTATAKISGAIGKSTPNESL